MTINIHWGEFCGTGERTEIHFPQAANQNETRNPVYQYYMQLRGYLPFTLFKNYITKQWKAAAPIDPSISTQVIFYTKKLIDDFELINQGREELQ